MAGQKSLQLKTLQAIGTAPPEIANNTKQTLQPISSICDVITKPRSVHVRWPGETGGAIGFALIFLLLFASRQKVDKDLPIAIGTRLKPQTSNLQLQTNNVFKGIAINPLFLNLRTQKNRK